MEDIYTAVRSKSYRIKKEIKQVDWREFRNMRNKRTGNISLTFVTRSSNICAKSKHKRNGGKTDSTEL